MIRSRWARNHAAIAHQLGQLRERIDALGDEAVHITGADRAYLLACYASNSIEGTLALLRDLEHLVMAGKRNAPRRRRRSS